MEEKMKGDREISTRYHYKHEDRCVHSDAGAKKKKFKKKKIPTYLPTQKNMGRVTANKQFFKDGQIEF